MRQTHIKLNTLNGTQILIELVTESEEIGVIEAVQKVMPLTGDRGSNQEFKVIWHAEICREEGDFLA